ncbi:MAG: immunoglobulin-like domain-containing protein [Eubacterium sp.]
MHKFFIIIRNIFAVLCIIIITLMLIFENKITSRIINSKTSTSNISAEPGKTSLSVPDDTLTYSGESSFDFLAGVTATDVDGSDISDKVTYQIISTDKSNQKTIKYSIMNSNFQEYSGERSLILENYEGPSITVDSDLSLENYDITNLIPILKSSDLIYAEDGYGNDISGNIYFSYKVVDTANAVYDVTFSITNAFGDTKNATISTKLSSDILSGPSIALIQHSVTISVGDTFDALEYVQYAMDPDDGDISDRIEINGSVDTTVAGEYLIYYYAINTAGKYSEPETLTVYVR